MDFVNFFLSIFFLIYFLSKRRGLVWGFIGWESIKDVVWGFRSYGGGEVGGGEELGGNLFF